MKKNDILLITGIVIIFTMFFVAIKWIQGQQENGHRIAVIKQNEKIVERIDLDATQGTREIKIPGEFEEIILVHDGQIRFAKADCPDKICVKTGWLKQKGDIAVCMPNKAIITIE